MSTEGPLRKSHLLGTHRLVAPEETLHRITPHLPSAQITRCADVTGLDRLGIPVFCAIRPQGRTLQVTNGKGLRAVDAKVSALMEAIELFHAENPPPDLTNASYREIEGEGCRAVRPGTLPGHLPDTFFSEDFRLDWVEGEELLTGEHVCLPASTAYLSQPKLHSFSTNGLASGNHLIEATLHAIYEVVERDALTLLEKNGRINLAPEVCRFIDVTSLPPGPLQTLREKLARAGITLVLIWLKAAVPLHTFFAVLLDDEHFSSVTTVNYGFGTHIDETVAAVRAVTEAAQIRLTYIHGSREDIKNLSYSAPSHKLYKFYSRIRPNAAWADLCPSNAGDLREDLAAVLAHLRDAGYEKVYRLDLTRKQLGVPVVKVIIPGMRVVRV